MVIAPPRRILSVRKHLSADGLYALLCAAFLKIPDHRREGSPIPLVDILMSAFAMFALKDPSLLAFEERRNDENMRNLFRIHRLPCDTQMRTRLDGLHPDVLRPAFKAVFRQAQRGKVLEPFVFMKGCYLISLDGTGYFSTEKLFSPYCLQKNSSKTGKTTYHLQTLAAVIVHPQQKEVIPLPPEPISNQDGQTKNDCERNAARRWLGKLRKDHPRLKAIVTEDGLSPNAPHIRDLKANRCHFILGVKEGDHDYLFNYIKEALHKGEAAEHEMADEEDPRIHHRFRFFHNVPLNQSNQDLRVNVLEYWECKDEQSKYFSWVTDFKITRRNAYQIMRGGRARWKVENETINTLKNQGYNFEHNYGLGQTFLSMIFVSLMMLAFLVDQIQQIACPVFRAARKKAGCKRVLWENIRAAFRLFFLDSMETIYRLIIAGPQTIPPTPAIDSS